INVDMWNYMIVGLLTGWLCAGGQHPGTGEKDVLAYVDPTIGGVGLILEPTRPLVHLPNSMLRVHPLKKDELADQLSGFPLTVVSHRIGSAFSFLPVFAEGDPWQSSITIHRQNAHPYAYEVVDAATYNSVVVTPSEKSGIFRMTNADRSTTHRLRF